MISYAENALRDKEIALMYSLILKEHLKTYYWHEKNRSEKHKDLTCHLRMNL